MSETVIVCGCDGYIGHALTLRLLFEGYKVIGIDDFRRRKYVDMIDSFSAMPINNWPQRHVNFTKIGDFDFHPCKLEHEFHNLKRIFKKYEPTAIVNLAQQPSAPFSFYSPEIAKETTEGNLTGTLNVLYAIKESGIETNLIQIGSMGEYNPAIGTEIPEGKFDLEIDGVVMENVLFPRAPGSIYHASKVASTYYIDCACKWWGISATDIMQGVVYGNWTPEIEETGMETRLDSDESFGTVVNRFIVQALIEEPLTIYGKGKHKRGFLSLNDSVQCLMLAIKNPTEFGEYRTWNQLDKVYSMVEASEDVAIAYLESGIGNMVEKTFIKSPRSENTDDFYYNPVVKKLSEIGFKPTRNIKDEATYIFNKLKDKKDGLKELKKHVIPKITWR